MLDKTRLTLLMLIGVLFSCQRGGVQERFLTYNVENLFDDVNNGFEYTEYRDYERVLYEQHLVNLAMVFDQISRKYGKLGVVFLQEVENENVAQTMVEKTASLQGMQVVFTKEPDHAIGVGMLVRYPLVAVEVFNPSNDEHKGLRSILAVVVKIKGQNMGLITSHLPSQRSVTNTAHRQHVLTQMGRVGQHLVDEYGNMPIVLAGDFNLNLAATEDNEIAMSTLMNNTEGQLRFVNPWPLLGGQRDEQDHPIKGSYIFRGEWVSLDGFLLSESLLDGEGLQFVDMFPIDFPWLVVPDTRYEDARVRLSSFGVKSTQGFSDHLPVMAVFK
jgi:endonuclease/exonuclease/phosphatase family metal-dependent hydrolase